MSFFLLLEKLHRMSRQEKEEDETRVILMCECAQTQRKEEEEEESLLIRGWNEAVLPVWPLVC